MLLLADGSTNANGFSKPYENAMLQAVFAKILAMNLKKTNVSCRANVNDYLQIRKLSMEQAARPTL